MVLRISHSPANKLDTLVTKLVTMTDFSLFRRRQCRPGIAISFGLIAIFTGLAPALAQENKTPPATPVKVDRVRLSPYNQTIPLIGRFVARQSGDVATRVSGAVQQVTVDVGDRVKAGDVVATLVQDRFEWQLNLQRAEVSNFTARADTKKAGITLLQHERQRIASLRDSPAFSQARLDDKEQLIAVAKSELAEAEANLRKARATLMLADIDFKNTRINAPFNGVVVQKYTSAGSYLNVGARVVTLVDDNTLEIEADVPSERATDLPPGIEVMGTFARNGRFRAIVRAVVPEENPQTRTRAVRFTPRLPDDQRGLAANQSVTLLLPHGEQENVLSVHKDAILDRRGVKLVVVPENGLATFHPVTLGDAVGGRFVVLDGLKEGDLVVIRGNERLRPKQPVSFDAQPPAPAETSGQPRQSEGKPTTRSDG